MNNYLKTGILLLTLAIPVFIWLFLKNFGQNQFALPVYYEESVPDIANCNTLDSPHAVSILKNEKNSLPTNNGIDQEVSVSYTLPEVCNEDCQLVLEELANLQTIFSDTSDFQILVFASDAYTRQKINKLKERYLANPTTWKFVVLENTSFVQLNRCGFLLSQVDFEQPLIMTDTRGRIRGYYGGSDQEEIDRLKGELKILYYMQESTLYD